MALPEELTIGACNNFHTKSVANQGFMTRVHNMSKELNFSLVKLFISIQMFQLLYSGFHQCNAEITGQNRHKILIKQSLKIIWVHSYMA